MIARRRSLTCIGLAPIIAAIARQAVAVTGNLQGEWRMTANAGTKLVRVSVALATALIAACASTPNTFSNKDPSVDFSQYRTYAFMGKLSTDQENYESLVSNFLKVAVSQQMDRRGLTYSDNPDLRVNFYINSKEKIRSRSVPTTGAYYGWRDPFYDTWGGYGGYETRVDQYTEGTLHIDVIDARTNQLVWEGGISGRVTDEAVRNLEQTIDGAVAAVFNAAFPLPESS
jgi:hypothetical protein